MTASWENAVKKAHAKKVAAVDAAYSKSITKPARRFRKRYIVAAAIAVATISGCFNEPTRQLLLSLHQSNPSRLHLLLQN